MAFSQEKGVQYYIREREGKRSLTVCQGTSNTLLIVSLDSKDLSQSSYWIHQYWEAKCLELVFLEEKYAHCLLLLGKIHHWELKSTGMMMAPSLLKNLVNLSSGPNPLRTMSILSTARPIFMVITLLFHTTPLATTPRVSWPINGLATFQSHWWRHLQWPVSNK